MASKTLSAVLAEIKENPNPYYVYVLRTPGGAPFYVGVGSGRRIADHAKVARAGKYDSQKLQTIRAIFDGDGDIAYEIDEWFERRTDAYIREMALIAKIGRSDLELGPLANLTSGGDGHGRCPSEETRRLLRVAKLGSRDSAEVREKKRQALLGRYVSEETRRRISIAHRGRVRPRYVVNKVAAAKRGKKLGPPSAETRAKISAAQVGKTVSGQSRARMSAAQRERFDRYRVIGGLRLPHHKGRTPSGRAKHRRPVEIDGIRHDGTDLASIALGVSRTTIKRWLDSGHRGARRMPKAK